MLHIYTDGGCIGNPGRGAWAFALYDTQTRAVMHQQSGYSAHTTNNQMELMAVISALEYCRDAVMPPQPLAIYTDSQYVMKGITEWIKVWIAHNWRKKDRKPLKNIELWQNLHRLSQRDGLVWHWVRGHAGHPMNELCHSLVHRAIENN